MNLYWTKNAKLYNFLWEQGIKPICEQGDNAAYIRTPKLLAALESYSIRNYFFKNRQGG